MRQDIDLELLRMMVRIRKFEDRLGEAFIRGDTAGAMLHLSVGEEAVAAGVGLAMKPTDFFTTHHRGHGVFIARGADPERMMAEAYGRTNGYCKGKGGSMHIADMDFGHMGSNAIVGGNIAMSLGGAFTLKYLGNPGVSVAFFGDGALNQGVLYESMNMAALWQLPAVFMVINNQYGMGTRIDHASACQEFVKRAESFGVPGIRCDGMEVEEVHREACELLERARGGGGPAFMIADAYRFYGHGRKDPSPYRKKDEEAKWRERDPITLQKQRLMERGTLTEDGFNELSAKIEAEVEKAATAALTGPEPEPDELYRDVYADEPGVQHA